MHSTALGKALLAFQPHEVKNRVLAGKLTKTGPRTMTTAPALREELSVIRHRGYAIDDEENARGTRCVAAPIRDHLGYAIAAMSISAPAYLFGDALIESSSLLVRDAALRVSVQIGYGSQTSLIN